MRVGAAAMEEGGTSSNEPGASHGGWTARGWCGHGAECGSTRFPQRPRAVDVGCSEGERGWGESASSGGGACGQHGVRGGKWFCAGWRPVSISTAQESHTPCSIASGR